MSQPTHESLLQLITDALERLAFVITDPTDQVDESLLTRHASIEYSGAEAGAVSVSASDAFLAELASSLLGVEPDEVNIDSEGVSALTELANILGGSLLTTLGGEAETFQLGLPHVQPGAPTPTDGAIECSVESDGEPLRVTWARQAA